MLDVPGNVMRAGPGSPSVALTALEPEVPMQKSAPSVGAIVLATPPALYEPPITPLSVKHSRRSITHVWPGVQVGQPGGLQFAALMQPLHV